MKNKREMGFIGIAIILVIAFMIVRSGYAHKTEPYYENASTVESIQEAEAEETADVDVSDAAEVSRGRINDTDTEYRFRSKKLLNQHYEKHGYDMGFKNAAAYEEAASKVINNPDALTKTEKEDGDFVYYVEATNEFVILSKDGYIRTYFEPDKGIDYYNRQ